MSLRFSRTLPAVLATIAALPGLAHAQLQVTYGSKGVQTLSYNGVSLENTNAFNADTFHIWHMKATDLGGNVLQGGQTGWGEVNNGSTWNPQTLTETYNFSWGSIATQFVQTGDTLNLIVTETNYANSGILFDGAEIYPFALHFPQDPAGFNGYTQYAITSTDPGISVADFGAGVVTAVLPDESKPLYTGWKNQGAATYSPMMTSTYPDGIATFFPHNDLPLAPGNTLTYTLSLRFTPEGTPANIGDATASFAQTYPSQMTWADKRMIGTAYLASSPAGGGDVTQPGGFPTNPRRYFNDASVDITSPAGLRSFQNRMLTQAANQVTNARNMNAQGVITWDLEGEQYPQDTSYVCSPDQIAAVSPEMESTISDPNSAFSGQKLDDAYFKTMTNAGLRVGLCLRPQVFTLGANGTASQQFLSTNAAIIANLENKARVANSRWGATLFYVDSVVDSNGGTLDPAIFQQIATDLPNLLFIPEEFTTRYYAYTAPFYSFIFHTTTGTAASVYNVYPHAFGANLVNDVDPGTLARYTPQLTSAVTHGDILMGHDDYWQDNDPTLVSLYNAAGITAPSAPLTTPAIAWPTPNSITFGTALSAAQLDATAGVAGTFTYSPALGTVLPAGTQTLTVNFTPTNTSAYKPTTATVQLTVGQATPAVNWPTPAGVPAGTALSGVQLNASANVPGSFTYTPFLGTVLPAGSNTLSATFTPADGTDYKSVTSTTTLTVAGVTTPTINWPKPAALTYGSALTSAQLNAAAIIPGTYTYSPAPGAVLPAGTQTLNVRFTPANTTAYNAGNATVQVTVNKATPTVSWPTPASVSAGTTLSAAQLDARASVPGTFKYSPAPGTVLQPGTTPLTVTFTPTDTTDYNTATATTTLTVAAASATTPSITWSTPAAIPYGTALTGAQLNATSTVPGTFAYSPALGKVPAAGNQILTVTFTPTNTAAYKATSSSVQLKVNKATPTVTWPTPATVSAGTALSGTQLNATANVPGTFTYTPATGAVLGAGTNALRVTFTPTDTNDYNSGSATTTLNVAPTATPSITWSISTPLTFGTPLSAAQLNATASVPGTFAYSPVAGTVLPAGNSTLKVTFSPSDTTRYGSATASVSVSVGKATPVINWPAPAPLSQGTPLSAQQLNATANVPGTFTYTAAAGTVLNTGNNPLTATFVAADQTNYTTASATVNVTVTSPAVPSGPVSLLSPSAGAAVSGNVVVTAQMTVHLDAAGSLLMVDGIPMEQTRTTGAPYVYPLNTTTLNNGVHLLQIWAHDINNNVVLSQPVAITVQN